MLMKANKSPQKTPETQPTATRKTNADEAAKCTGTNKKLPNFNKIDSKELVDHADNQTTFNKALANPIKEYLFSDSYSITSEEQEDVVEKDVEGRECYKCSQEGHFARTNI